MGNFLWRFREFSSFGNVWRALEFSYWIKRKFLTLKETDCCLVFRKLFIDIVLRLLSDDISCGWTTIVFFVDNESFCKIRWFQGNDVERLSPIIAIRVHILGSRRRREWRNTAWRSRRWSWRKCAAERTRKRNVGRHKWRLLLLRRHWLWLINVLSWLRCLTHRSRRKSLWLINRSEASWRRRQAPQRRCWRWIRRIECWRFWQLPCIESWCRWSLSWHGIWRRRHESRCIACSHWRSWCTNPAFWRLFVMLITHFHFLSLITARKKRNNLISFENRKQRVLNS